jgi:hypothetical protein
MSKGENRRKKTELKGKIHDLDNKAEKKILTKEEWTQSHRGISWRKT